jgi:hypothetical protein
MMTIHGALEDGREMATRHTDAVLAELQKLERDPAMKTALKPLHAALAAARTDVVAFFGLPQPFSGGDDKSPQ